jgi:hypothetical protein
MRLESGNGQRYARLSPMPAPPSAGANTGNDERCAPRDAAETTGKLVRSDRDCAGCPVERFTGVVTEQDPSEERVPRGTNHDQIGGTLPGEVVQSPRRRCAADAGDRGGDPGTFPLCWYLLRVHVVRERPTRRDSHRV